MIASEWVEFHRTYMEIAEEGKTPIFFFRYEDLIENPIETMEKVFCFVLGVDSLQDTFI